MVQQKKIVKYLDDKLLLWIHDVIENKTGIIEIIALLSDMKNLKEKLHKIYDKVRLLGKSVEVYLDKAAKDKAAKNHVENRKHARRKSISRQNVRTLRENTKKSKLCVTAQNLETKLSPRPQSILSTRPPLVRESIMSKMKDSMLVRDTQEALRKASLARQEAKRIAAEKAPAKKAEANRKAANLKKKTAADLIKGLRATLGQAKPKSDPWLGELSPGEEAIRRRRLTSRRRDSPVLLRLLEEIKEANRRFEKARQRS